MRFIWLRSLRPWWVAATVGLHLGIGVTMGLWMFSVMMILMTMSAFGLPPLLTVPDVGYRWSNRPALEVPIGRTSGYGQ
jgi:hypothetical protein